MPLIGITHVQKRFMVSNSPTLKTTKNLMFCKQKGTSIVFPSQNTETCFLANLLTPHTSPAESLPTLGTPPPLYRATPTQAPRSLRTKKKKMGRRRGEVIVAYRRVQSAPQPEDNKPTNREPASCVLVYLWTHGETTQRKKKYEISGF